MSLVAALAALALIAAGAAVLYLIVDRSSRADAWRRIAEERRWNAEHRVSPKQ